MYTLQRSCFQYKKKKDTTANIGYKPKPTQLREMEAK